MGTGPLAGKYLPSMVSYCADIQRGPPPASLTLPSTTLALTHPFLPQRLWLLESNKPISDSGLVLSPRLEGLIFGVSCCLSLALNSDITFSECLLDHTIEYCLPYPAHHYSLHLFSSKNLPLCAIISLVYLLSVIPTRIYIPSE